MICLHHFSQTSNVSRLKDTIQTLQSVILCFMISPKLPSRPFITNHKTALSSVERQY